MLQSIRDRTQGWLTNTVIGLLIIVFALWGIHGYLELNNESGNKIVAKIAGQTLSQRDFDSAYQRLYRQAQIQLGIAALNNEVTSQLKKQTIAQWSLSEVLSQSALQENYRLSQSAINNVLLNLPIFQSSGRFSSTRFYSVLEALGYTELSFLSNLKKTLLIDQVRQGLTQTAFSLPEEFDRAIALTRQKRDFAYTIIPSTQFSEKQLPVSAAQALVYYQHNKDQFVQPEQVSIEYIQLSLNNVKNDKVFVDKRDRLANLTFTHPDSLESAAKALNLSIQSTPLFGRKGGKDSLTKNAKVIAAAFSRDILQGNNSPVIDLTNDISIVMRIRQHNVAMVQPFSKVRAQILQALQKKMITEEANKVGEKLLRELKTTGVFSEKTNKLHLDWHIINKATRNSDKVSSPILNAVFNLSSPKKSEGVTSVTGFSLPNGEYVLIKLIAVHEGTNKDLSYSQKKAYSKELVKSFGQLDYDLYVRGLMLKYHLA
ncbi:MAG: SurA N-terminal domain-containing protein [Rickettsiella sp.]|nr:SurA N-terminal domain-containing protein [Rickettsiella sp.]